MPSNTIGPLPKKSDASSEKVEKASGDLDDIEILVERIPTPHPLKTSILF